MKPSAIMNRMVYWYRAGDSVCLLGPPGVGKTAVIKRAPFLLKQAHPGKRFAIVILNAANLEVMETQGYLVPKHSEGGRSFSVFTLPFYWNLTWVAGDDGELVFSGEPLDAFDGSIIFVDEIDKALVEVKKILGEACHSDRVKRLGPHVLPPGCIVWLAGNRAVDKSGSTKDLPYLTNRIRFLNFEADLADWTEWATTNGVTPTTIAFANNNPEIVFSGKVPDVNGQPYCTARSLVKADKYMQQFADPVTGDINLKDQLLFEEVAGDIGEAATAQYKATLQLGQNAPTLASIIADPMKAKLPEGNPGALMLICFRLAHSVDKSNADPVVKYVARMPKEFGVTFAKAACNKSSVLVTTPAFQKWAMDNSSLMALIAKK